MVYKLRPATEVARDIELIGDYLFQTYQGFGDDLDGALFRAASRVKDALDYMESLAVQPHRGTEHPKVRPGLRSVTNNRFIFYFEVDEPLSEVRILAVFFGGMDHQRQILDRLRPKKIS